jgi:long-chain acyl-CoA synthetase
MAHRNLNLLFQDRVKVHGEKTFIIRKAGGRWRDVSWNQVAANVKITSLGLISLGIESRDRIAILSETRAEWLYAYLAILATGGILAPIYHTNSPDQCRYVINDSGSRFAFAEDQEQLDKFLAGWQDMPIPVPVLLLPKTRNSWINSWPVGRTCLTSRKSSCSKITNSGMIPA